MKSFKALVVRLLIILRVFPNIFFTFMPFKVFEFREIMRDVNITKDHVVLDIGCGNGIQTALLAGRCKKVVGIDVSAKSVKYAKRIADYVGWVDMDIRLTRLEDAQFENESFDKIFSFCVIEHIYNYENVLREAYRVLKRGGQMAISVDSLENIEDKDLIAKHRKDYSVMKYFNRNELAESLEAAGFKNVTVYPVFKSEFAKRLFINGIRNKYKYGYIRSFLLYIVLRRAERIASCEDKGIFLIAKCRK